MTLLDEEHHLEGFFHVEASVGKVAVVVPDNRAVDIIHQHHDGVGCVMDGVVHGAHNQTKVHGEEDAVTVWDLAPEESYGEDAEEHDGPEPPKPPHRGPEMATCRARLIRPLRPLMVLLRLTLQGPRRSWWSRRSRRSRRPRGPGGPHHDKSSIRVVADVGNAKIIF